MSFTRRQLLARLAAAGAVGATGLAGDGSKAAGQAAPAAAALTLDPGRLTPFVDPLPRPATARGEAPNQYRMTMRQAECQLHRDLPPTRLWTYGDGYGAAGSPGPTIEARSGDAVRVHWINALPERHFLPIDHTIEGAGRNVPDVRTVVHMHGARVPSASDGYPEDWYAPGGSQRCEYPNRQDAAALFYHDHAMGVNRLNVYAGLFGLMVLRDAAEEALALPAGEYEIPITLCDRWLTAAGQLYYPVSGIPGRPWVPEVFGNAMLANGKLLPYLEVEPRAYRLRFANTSNARILRLQLSPRLPLHLIGTDQGLLGAPVTLRSLPLAPAERADVVVDFSGSAGERLVLRDGESMPVLQVRVGSGGGSHAWRRPARLRPLVRLDPAAAVRRRQLTLAEYLDAGGFPKVMLLDNRYWSDPVTEQPALDSTEIWEFVNLTSDTHPIHLHMVRFQVLERQPLDVNRYLNRGGLRFTGPVAAPGADEMGWKDTVRAYAGVVTRIIIPFAGYAGRYLWHCHILEHEANDMMRPYDVFTKLS